VSPDEEYVDIHLSGRDVLSIDLSQLSAVTSMRTLDLSSNRIGTLGLGPLCRHREIESLILYENHMSSLDLTPLSVCTSLRELRLFNNGQLTELHYDTTLVLNSNSRPDGCDMNPLLEELLRRAWKFQGAH